MEMCVGRILYRSLAFLVHRMYSAILAAKSFSFRIIESLIFCFDARLLHESTRINTHHHRENATGLMQIYNHRDKGYLFA